MHAHGQFRKSIALIVQTLPKDNRVIMTTKTPANAVIHAC